MASLILGTTSMASQLLSSPSSSLSFSRSYAFAGYSLFTVPISSPSNSGTSSAPSLIYCGRGDRKTAKGKRFNHSFGNARPKNKNKGRGPPKAPVPPSARKKDPFDDNEKVKIQIDE